MKGLTYSQVKSFKEKLIRFNNDLIKKNKIKKDFDDYYEKHKIKAVKDIKYLSNDFVYKDIRCLFNETNDIESNESNEINSYEGKPYEVEYYEVRSNEIKSYEIGYIDIKPVRLNLANLYLTPLNLMRLNLVRITVWKILENEFNKLSNNLVEANTKDIRYIVDHINNVENLKETLINLEDIIYIYLYIYFSSSDISLYLFFALS